MALNTPIVYTTPGMWDPADRMPGFPTGFFARGEMPPFVDRWPDGWAPWDHRPMGAARPSDPQEAPADQWRAPSGPGQGEESQQLPFGPRQSQTVRWKEVIGMAWIRPVPADTHGGPLWSAAPVAPGSRWGPLRLSPGRNFDFVNKLQDYGSLQVQRFLDIDWPKVVHSVTEEIFPQEGEQGALLSRPSPTTPIGYGQAREFFLLQYGRLLEGRGSEAFGSTLADYIFTEISARAGTCGDNAHYKVVDNGLWYFLGQYAEPSPGSHSYAYFPPDNTAGRNQTGNVYEALVGLYWLEGETVRPKPSSTSSLPSWTSTRSSTPVGRFRRGRAPQGPCEVPTPSGAPGSPSSERGEATATQTAALDPVDGAVAEPRQWWLQEPGVFLWIDEWVDGYVGHMPKGSPLPLPPPRGPPPSRGGPRNTANPGGAVQLRRPW